MRADAADTGSWFSFYRLTVFRFRWINSLDGSGSRLVPGTSPAARSRQMAHANANRAPANHVAARQQRAPVARNTPRASTPARRVPRALVRYSARNNAIQHPAERSTGEVRSVLARPVAPRNQTLAHHAALQPSHHSERNTPARQTGPSRQSSAQPVRRAVPPSHYMAHANPAPRPAAPAPHGVKPRESAPRPSGSWCSASPGWRQELSQALPTRDPQGLGCPVARTREEP